MKNYVLKLFLVEGDLLPFEDFVKQDQARVEKEKKPSLAHTMFSGPTTYCLGYNRMSLF
jgi:hypothetical protein